MQIRGLLILHVSILNLKAVIFLVFNGVAHALEGLFKHLLGLVLVFH